MRSVVKTLFQRADSLISTKEDREEEIHHVKQALGANGYQKWIFNLPQKTRKQPSEIPSNTRNKRIPPIGLPYVKGLSENLQRLFRSYNIPSYHKPFNTIHSLLVKPKDKTPKESLCGLVYHIQCRDCHHNYIGETGRNLGTRFKEHTARKGHNSAVKEHLDKCGHRCTLDDVKVLDREDHWYRRKIKEAILIQRHQPTLNRDQGLELAPVFCSLLSRDTPVSRDFSAPQQRH